MTQKIGYTKCLYVREMDSGNFLLHWLMQIWRDVCLWVSDGAIVHIFWQLVQMSGVCHSEIITVFFPYDAKIMSGEMPWRHEMTYDKFSHSNSGVWNLRSTRCLPWGIKCFFKTNSRQLFDSGKKFAGYGNMKFAYCSFRVATFHPTADSCVQRFIFMSSPHVYPSSSISHSIGSSYGLIMWVDTKMSVNGIGKKYRKGLWPSLGL